MHVRLEYSEEYKNERFVLDGKEISGTEILDVPLPELSTTARRLALKVKSKAPIYYESGVGQFYDLTAFSRNGKPFRVYKPGSKYQWNSLFLAWLTGREVYETEMREKQNDKLAELHIRLKDMAAQERIVLPEGRIYPDFGDNPDLYDFAHEGLKEAVSTLQAELRERWQAQETADAQERRRKVEEEKQRKIEEKMAWVREHGSPHLKESCAEGYDCQRLYAKERAKYEHPEYILDFDELAHWRERSCPSPKALAEAKRVGGKVVWLTTPAYEMSNDPYHGFYYVPDDFEPKEAVVITNYLGKYDLVREI